MDTLVTKERLARAVPRMCRCRSGTRTGRARVTAATRRENARRSIDARVEKAACVILRGLGRRPNAPRRMFDREHSRRTRRLDERLGLFRVDGFLSKGLA